ncbi:MAG: nuclear transport factor 2 family protein, partial [Thermoanaerobaculia bacterium]
FTDDAAHHWTPFSEPKRGIAEIRKAFDQSVSNQRNIDFDYAVLGVVGDRGIAHWWCHLTRLGTNAAVRLDGIFCAEFRGDKCYQFREWWHTIGDTETEVATSPAGD